MKLIMILFLLIATLSNVDAYETISQVKDIDQGSNLDSEALIFLSNGRVVRVRKESTELLSQLQKAKIEKKWLKFKVPNKSLDEVSVSSHPFKSDHIKNLTFKNEPQFEPSILPSIDRARLLFNDAKLNPKESQCYNRAHVWVYDWRIKNNVYSSKVWIFFTRKYIREHKFEWWFHVAPVVHVLTENEVKRRVMDIKYSRGPLSINRWTDIFMRNSAKCPIVDKYSDQADYPESASCFLMLTSMYYYQPVDLDMLERKGTVRSRWSYSEVKHAFEEAFEINI